MSIDSISPIAGVSESLAVAAELAYHLHASPSQVAAYEAKATGQLPVPALADDGDPIALADVEQLEARLTPVAAQPVEPAHLEHAPGAVEPGKGTLIDVYD